ncbi:MAG TPA: Fe-S-containing protein [Bacteroidota bacterium]|nr:Fe-S-containing protein [Bacteroidota bacterium]
MKCSTCGNELSTNDKFCSHCGSKVDPVSSSVPSQQHSLPSSAFVLGKKGMSNRAKAMYGGIAFCLLIGMGVVFVHNLPGGENPVIEKQPTVSQPVNYEGVKLTMTPVQSKVENGYIIIALSDVLEKKMVGFTYDGKNKQVDLLAYINPEGKLVTSIAMCEPCNSKSFHTESNDIVCDNCGTRWNFTTLEGISGTCQKYPPDPIPSEIVGNEIRIDEKSVENWKMRI